MIKHETDTSKWALAIHRVSATTVEVWVGTLYPTMTKPRRARVRLELPRRVTYQNNPEEPVETAIQKYQSEILVACKFQESAIWSGLQGDVRSFCRGHA